MSKSLIRIVTLLLVPCLLADPSLAHITINQPVLLSPRFDQYLEAYNTQALNLPDYGAQYPWYLNRHKRCAFILSTAMFLFPSMIRSEQKTAGAPPGNQKKVTPSRPNHPPVPPTAAEAVSNRAQP